MSTWQVQEAKAKFSEVVRLAETAPQFVTVRGKPAVVVISVDKYMQLSEPKKSLIELLQSAPCPLDKLELPERKSEPMREIDLCSRSNQNER